MWHRAHAAAAQPPGGRPVGERRPRRGEPFIPCIGSRMAVHPLIDSGELPPRRDTPSLGAAVAHLRAADPVLDRVIAAAGELIIRPARDPYRELVRSIIYQQLAGPAAATIERRFRALYDHGDVPATEELLATPDEALRGAGISRQKISYLRDLAAKGAAGVVSEHLRALPDDEVIAAVTSVKGVGRWTADMLLIFCLGRPDVLPVGDLGTRKAMQRAYALPDLPAPAEMERIAAPWRPYRSTATRYLWRWLDAPTEDTGG